MDWLTSVLIQWVGPVALGWGFNWIANKCRGRNAKNAFKSLAWGSWLLLLVHVRFLIPIPFLNLLIALVPSAICYLLAASHFIKEMRAQKEGEFTDAA